MTANNEHFKKLDVPLKKEFPCLQYDFAVYCEVIKSIVNVPFPRYLSKLDELMTYYSNHVEDFKPEVFPDAYRVYIVDYRMNILFAALDTTGKMAAFMVTYLKEFANLEDCYYGDGTLPFDPFLPVNYDLHELKKFSDKYEFLPVEELSMPKILIFRDEEMKVKMDASQYQIYLLLEKFKARNLIDWKTMIKDVTEFISG